MPKMCKSCEQVLWPAWNYCPMCGLAFSSVAKGGDREAVVRSNVLLGREAAPAKRKEGCSTRPLGRRSRPNDCNDGRL